MALLNKIYTALALAAAALVASSIGVNVHAAAVQNATVPRHLGTGSGFIGACYTPFHNYQYPLNGGAVNVVALRQSIDDDFRLLSKHVTHIRTYYAMHYDIEIVPIAAKYNLKVYLGVFLTTESWWATEVKAVENAVNNYPNTVEAVLVGNENMINFAVRSGYILGKVNEIKRAIGANAGRVKYGTVQRVTEYLDSRFDGEMWNLVWNLDILGVNIYPFFNNDYDASKPADLLDRQWNAVANKYPRSKLRLTETGFPTAGAPSSLSPRVQPSLDGSVKYYEAVVDWTPAEYARLPKFWFQAFDRRWDDKTATADLERYFGFFTIERNYKRGNFPHFIASSATCKLEDGVDYKGNDIGSVASAKAEPCCDICSGWSGCRAFTWSVYNGGTCWLKSAKGDFKTGVAGVTSSVLQ